MTRLKLIFQKLSKKQQRAKRVATLLSDISNTIYLARISYFEQNLELRFLKIYQKHFTLTANVIGLIGSRFRSFSLVMGLEFFGS